MNNFSLHASNGCSLREKNLNGGKKKKKKSKPSQWLIISSTLMLFAFCLFMQL
jgi:hypothetical protein